RSLDGTVAVLDHAHAVRHHQPATVGLEPRHAERGSIRGSEQRRGRHELVPRRACHAFRRLARSRRPPRGRATPGGAPRAERARTQRRERPLASTPPSSDTTTHPSSVVEGRASCSRFPPRRLESPARGLDLAEAAQSRCRTRGRIIDSETHRGVSRSSNMTDNTRRPIAPAAEEILGTYFPVLDHGFVALVDYMGTDACIERAARVSY